GSVSPWPAPDWRRTWNTEGAEETEECGGGRRVGGGGTAGDRGGRADSIILTRDSSSRCDLAIIDLHCVARTSPTVRRDSRSTRRCCAARARRSRCPAGRPGE